MNKYVSSIDGFFKKKIKLVNLEFNKKNFSQKNTILGKGNSISQLPYVENFNSIELNLSKKFFIDKKKKLITVNGNAKISDVHNFLLENKYYCHYFPSYPSVTVGACIANGTHGIIPKKEFLLTLLKKSNYIILILAKKYYLNQKIKRYSNLQNAVSG